MEERRKRGRPHGKKEINKQLILKKALTLFARHNFDGITLKAIAQEVGVADSLLHYHFGNKSELWKSAIKAVIDELLSGLEELGKQLKYLEGEYLLKKLFKSYLIFCSKYPDFYRILSQEVMTESDRAEWIIETCLRPVNSIIHEYLEREIKRGNMKQMPLATVSHLFFVAANSFFSHAKMLRKMHQLDPFSPDQLSKYAEDMSEIFCQGMIVSTAEKFG